MNPIPSLVTTIAIATATLALTLSACAPGQLISRKDFFQRYDNLHPRLSPDGSQMAYLKFHNGNSRLVIRNMDARTEVMRWLPLWPASRGIFGFFWHPDGKHLLYWHDNDGDENYHLYQLDLFTGELLDLLPLSGARTGMLASELTVPGQILVTTNSRDKRFFDVYRVDLASHRATLEYENPGNVTDWMIDGNLRIRGLAVSNGGRDIGIRLWDESNATYRAPSFLPDSMSIASLVGNSPNMERIWVLGHYKSDRLQLIEIEPGARAYRILHEDKKFDLDDSWTLDSTRTRPVTGLVEREKTVRVQLAPAFKDAIADITAGLQSEFGVVSRDRRDRHWIVRPITDSAASGFYAYDHARRKLEFLFNESDALLERKFRPMEPITYKARDGLSIDGYLTLPERLPGDKPAPMILQVHGGPWSRTTWGFDTDTQWLANRGYGVLDVNFRGSSGYGASFKKAGNLEWGGKMLDDLIDAKKWAVENGYAQADKVCIMGGSYGGYAVLSAVTTYPDEFACGVASSSISDLVSFVKDVPPYWDNFNLELRRRVGDPEKDAKLLHDRSPVHHADRVKTPLLMVHGVNDVRTRRSQGDLMAQALRAHGKKVDYYLMPELGHSTAPAINYRIEYFLAKHLGGSVEGVDANELRNDDSK